MSSIHSCGISPRALGQSRPREKKRRTRLLEIIPKITSEDIGRDARHLRRRAARSRLRLHLRQQPAACASVVAGRRRRHVGQDRGRGARVHLGARRARGRDRHHPQPEGPDLPPARRVGRGRGAGAEGRRRHGQGRRHRGAGRPRDPEPGPGHLPPGREGPVRDDADDRARPRLRAGRGQQGPRDDHRRDPGRLHLLARAACATTTSTPPASASAPTSTSSSSR